MVRRVELSYKYIQFHLKGVVSWMSVIRGHFVLKTDHWERGSCPLSGIKKRPLLGGCVSIATMCSTDFVRCREVVRFSEDPLWEVRL